MAVAPAVTCARCDLPIGRGEPYEVLTVDVGTGAAPAVVVHRVCPEDPQYVRRYSS